MTDIMLVYADWLEDGGHLTTAAYRETIKIVPDEMTTASIAWFSRFVDRVILSTGEEVLDGDGGGNECEGDGDGADLYDYCVMEFDFGDGGDGDGHGDGSSGIRSSAYESPTEPDWLWY